MTGAPDFGRLAARYDELRPADERWWLLTEALVDEVDLRGRRVLDIGCGTGMFAAALAERYAAKVWGVDASAEMLAEARRKVPRGVGLRLGRAEDLPFRDGWFERAVMCQSVHLVARRRAFDEARRVLAREGRLAVATFDPEHFDGYWLNAYFPSLRDIDLDRFPSEATLRAELAGAGFSSVKAIRRRSEAVLDRPTALDRVRGKHISTLQLLPEGEYAEGLARLERELPESIPVEADHLIVTADPRPTR